MPEKSAASNQEPCRCEADVLSTTLFSSANLHHLFEEILFEEIFSKYNSEWLLLHRIILSQTEKRKNKQYSSAHFSFQLFKVKVKEELEIEFELGNDLSLRLTCIFFSNNFCLIERK